MMVTAEEAKTKWCPFARVWSLDSGAVNRTKDSGSWPNCIADGCMMWEWRTNPGAESGKQPKGVCGLSVFPILTSLK
jgi:hypothetical protein